MGTSLILGTILGIVFGIVAAIRQYSLFDYLMTGFSTSFIAIPGFVVGLVLIYILGASLKILPTTGMFTLGKGNSIQDLVAHMVMPVTLLSVGVAAQLTRYTRASMLEVLSSEFVTTARSKGLRGRIVLLRHAFRNALIPILTVVGLTVSQDLLAGAVITEQLFGWPGMGQLAVKAASSRDPALMMGVIIVVATGVLLTNLIVDVLYAYVDPRIRVGNRN
jgi:peptide/nickel transport system permease protein